MSKKIRLLLVEDSEYDKELIILHLKRGGLDVEFENVETLQSYKSALDTRSWDLVISDYSLPTFNGITALNILHEKNIDIPFILVSGAIGEDVAVKAMKAGASDYLMKDNLNRLIPAIKRELKEAKLRAKYRKVEREQKRLEELVQQSLNEIYIFDSSTLRFKYVNKITLNNLGYSLQEMKKLTPVDLKEEYTKESFYQNLQPLFDKTEEKVVLNTFHTRKNGTKYPVEAHIQVIEEDDHKLFAAIVLNLTTHKRSESIILKQKKMAQELALNNKYKTEFLANMSHELRTPLNSIILLSKLLDKKKSSLPEKARAEYIEEIQNSAHSLMSLINDVLDVSKIEAGRMSFNLKELNISKLLTKISHTFKYLANEKGLRLTISNSMRADKCMLTDPLRVEQILNNFLSNAIKFTEKGYINVVARLPIDGELDNKPVKNKDVIVFAVKDTGIGMNKENLNEIFEAFQQVDGSDERRFKGTGLGLSISKQIAVKLGGAISVDSTLGEGSTFSVYLPINSKSCIDEQNTKIESIKKLVAVSGSKVHSFPENRRLSSSASGKRKFNILLADDSEIHVSALKELVENKERTCTIAKTAQEILSQIEKSVPDLLVLDLGLPDADGLDVIRKIRKQHPLSRLPIIVYTGRVLTSAIKNMYAGQVNMFITKSGDSFQTLSDAIDSILQRAGDLVNDTGSFEDLRFLENKRVLIIDDNDRNLYSLSKSLEEYPLKIFVGKSGQDAFHFLNTNGLVDLILMDIMMPEMSGFEVISKIKENDQWKHIPIIAVTAKATPEDKIKCMEAGASDYVPKPIDFDYLFSKMIHWLKKQS